MGCDIHLYTEKRQVDGTWVAIEGVNEPKVKEYEELAEKCKSRGESPDYWLERVKELREGDFNFIWDDRSYILFAILAGVRNSYQVTPISAPKGLPSDISEVAKERADYWGVDGHSHSYLTVAELSAFDGDQGFQQEGWVSPENYKRWKENGSPDMWSRSVGGGGTDHVTHYDMENFIADNGEYYSFGRTPYTLVQWKNSYKDCVGSFHTWSVPKLRELAGDDLESIRIVFWFDN